MSDEPNDRQVGGNHYASLKYQPWDFIHDHDIPFIPGCAIKYVSRWRAKGDTEDLEKALHHIEKCKHENIIFELLRVLNSHRGEFKDSDYSVMMPIYMDQFDYPEQRIMTAICDKKWMLAKSELTAFIEFQKKFSHKKRK